MAFLIDTNILIRLERDRVLPEALLDRSLEESIYIAAITASELLHGVERAAGKRRQRRQQFVEATLETIDIIPFDLEIARTHAKIWARLQSQGKVIGSHDLLIAATAVTHELPLVTANVREFIRVEELDLITA